MGYHLKKIEKGIVGEVSKIREELEELEDAVEQKNAIMALCELSDIVLAIDLYLEHNYDNLSIYDVLVMAEATRRAFEDGSRT